MQELRQALVSPRPACQMRDLPELLRQVPRLEMAIALIPLA